MMCEINIPYFLTYRIYSIKKKSISEVCHLQNTANIALYLGTMLPWLYFNDLTWKVLFTEEKQVTHLVYIFYNGAEVSVFWSSVGTSLSAISSSITAGLVRWFTCGAQSWAVAIFFRGTSLILDD